MIGRLGLVAACVCLGGLAASCRAQNPGTDEAQVQQFAPSETRKITDFGAAGDGRRDDTVAVRQALSQSGSFCLDGEGKTYRVTGTLRVANNLCLKNATLLQSMRPFDTAKYVVARCPVTKDVSALIDCGDPTVRAQDLGGLNDSLAVRTLFIRPKANGGSLRVTLDHVTVNRGIFPGGGSRAESAGIWLQGADRADLRSVEVTGFGKGYGLLVSHSRNVAIDDLWIHDLIWSPYPGEQPLQSSRMAAIGWNAVPVHEFRAAGSPGAKVGKFYGMRVQEQLTCAFFVEVEDVIIRNARISHCMARLQDGDFPWQSDGLDISRSSSRITIDNVIIDSTWNAIDVVGGGAGVSDLTITNMRATNAFTFAIKLGYQLRNVELTNVQVANAGLAGVVLYGPVAKVRMSGIKVTGVGLLSANGATFVPWPRAMRSGIEIQSGPSGGRAGTGAPRDIVIADTTVSNAAGAPAYDYGIVNDGGSQILLRQFRATGNRKAEVKGLPARKN